MSEIKSPPPPVIVTENAFKRLRAILAHEARDDLHLRVSVEGGGCSGFQYKFDLDDQIEPEDIKIEQEGATIVVDGLSLMYLLGARLDFVEDLTGSYFRIDNPNAQSSCGCGNSFAI
ncbi:MAG: iron-sulfur cluster insertion protein ErpA [Geminicoccaceae bacterium]